jgi:hypothetical protein
MRKPKRILMLALCCLPLWGARPVSEAAWNAIPFYECARLESTREEICLRINCLNAEVETCVIEADAGTLAMDMADAPSFQWDRETRRMSVVWNGAFILRYRPAAPETPFLEREDELAGSLLVSYYDRQEKCVARWRVNIVRAFRYLLAQQEPVKE